MGYQQTKSRYEKAGKAKGGAAGLSVGAAGGAAVGSLFGPVGTVVGGAVGGTAGWLIGKAKGKKAGSAEGRRAFLSSNRKRVSKLKGAEDRAQLAALRGSGGASGKPFYSDDQVLQDNISGGVQTVGPGGRHNAWKAQTFGDSRV